MSSETKPSWERFGDAMLDWGGFLLLAFATFLGVTSGDPDPAWKATTLGIAAVAAAWLYVGYTRRPLPNVDHLVRLDVFFVGLLVLASILMLRQPLFFIFMIAGFFYATILRPLPLAVVGIVASSILVNTLIAGVPQTPEGLDVLPRDHRRPDDRDQRRRGDRREGHRAERGTPRRARPARGGAGGERRPPRPAAHAGARGGHPRRAPADGARDPRHDRPGPDRDHHAARGRRPGARPPGRPGSPPRQRRAAGPREPDRGAPLGRGLDARRAGVGDRCRRRSTGSRASGRTSTGSRSTSGSPARSSPSTRTSRSRSCGRPRRRSRTSPGTPAPPAPA